MVEQQGADCFDEPAGIVVEGVSKRLQGKVVLDGVSVVFPRGCISGIRGANGSGKTMLLRAIAGLITLDEGSLSVLGKQLADGDVFPDSMGFLIEPLKLWDDMSGFQNLKLLASMTGVADDGQIRATLARVGLDPRDRRWIRSYSLGMRQRLSIAQAIMERPSLILLDEPTNALDDDGKRLVRGILVEEKRRGATIVVVSHDADELKAISDYRFVMANGTIREDR